jgi:hypothetical protein
VKDECGPEVGSEALPTEPEERLGRGGKQGVVDDNGMEQSERSQLGGEGEDGVEMMGRKHAFLAFCDPGGLRGGLARRAVTIAAGVVGRASKAAFGALVQVTPKDSGATGEDGSERPRLWTREDVALPIRGSVVAEDVRDA